MDARSDAEFGLGILRPMCEAVVEAYGGGDELAASLGGVYFGFKSVKFVYRIHDVLMSEPALLYQGNGDEAGYFAETMIRALHSSGDLLARAIVECGHAKGDYIKQLRFDDGAEGLKPLVDELLICDAWGYLSSFANTSKHSAFIDRTSLSRDDCESHQILFKEFDYRGTVYTARSFDEVLNYAVELRDSELSILYWLMDHAPPESPATRRLPELESRISPITASFTAPSSSKFHGRPFEAP
jgi:hypothetical protein